MDFLTILILLIIIMSILYVSKKLFDLADKIDSLMKPLSYKLKEHRYTFHENTI